MAVFQRDRNSVRVLLVATLAMASVLSGFSATFSVPVAIQGSAQPAISMLFEQANPNPEMLRLLEFAGNIIRPDADISSPAPLGAPANLPIQWRVIYRNIYPGIDLAAYRSGGRIQYDLIVSPGADLTQVRITYQGLEHMELQGRFPGYQIIQGVRVDVPVKICRSLNKSYILEPAPYDPNAELIIPTTQTPLTAVNSNMASN